ncbi:MAG: hypothetical protein APR55_08180 [Methanolinea sp. SDB]|nr:MAG: hypothetical protein APR55_08180 [Methanolinea sp. SDB]
MAKLHAVWICLDCEEVYTDKRDPGTCPVCGSRAGWPLRRWVHPALNVRAAHIVKTRMMEAIAEEARV